MILSSLFTLLINTASVKHNCIVYSFKKNHDMNIAVHNVTLSATTYIHLS